MGFYNFGNLYKNLGGPGGGPWQKVFLAGGYTIGWWYQLWPGLFSSLTFGPQFSPDLISSLTFGPQFSPDLIFFGENKNAEHGIIFDRETFFFNYMLFLKRVCDIILYSFEKPLIYFEPWEIYVFVKQFPLYKFCGARLQHTAKSW